MDSLQLLIFQLLTIVTCSTFSEPVQQQDGQEMKSCPNHKPITEINIDQVKTKS